MVKENVMKQTEIGLIPEDWKVYTVLELIDLLTDYDANGSFSSVAENVKSYNYEEYAWYVRSTDLENNSNLSNVKYVDKSSYDFLKKTSLYGGELLFLKRGDIGNVYLFEMRTEKATLAPNLYLLKLNKVSSSKYLYQYFISEKGQSQLKSKNAGSTLGALYKDDVKSILVPLPPLPEQEAIAEALSNADAWIESLEQLIAKKRLIKQGAMQELLSPKVDWEVKKLGEMGNIVIGLTYSPSDVRDFGTLVLRSSNIQHNKLAFENNVFVDMDLPERVIVKENDLLVCVRNGSKNLIGKCALIDKKTEGQAFGAFMSVVRSDFGEYLYHYFQTYHIQTQIDENLGATINQLTNATLKSFDINLPKSLTEQTRIATILSDMDAELEALEGQLGKARKVKQGMMQELLTGRVRLV